MGNPIVGPKIHVDVDVLQGQHHVLSAQQS